MRRSRLLWLALPLCAATLLAPTGGNAAGAPRVSKIATDVLRPGFQGEDSDAPGTLDNRVGSVKPTATQLAIVKKLGAKATWSQFGSPRSLFNRHDLYLSGPMKGDAATVGRAWIRDNAALFGLTPELTEPAHLQLVANNRLYESPDNRRIMAGLEPLAKDSTVPHVLLFRQLFGGIEAAQEGMINLTLDPDNRVVYVASGVTRDTKITNTRKIDVVEAWRTAAASVGWHVPASQVKVLDGLLHGEWTRLQVPNVKDPQIGRLRAIPTPKDGVRLAWEVNTVDNDRVATGQHEPLAYITFVDAQTNKVIHRANAVFYAGGGVPASMSVPSVGPKTQVPDPKWKVFPNTPQFATPGVASPDDRQMWCWSVAATGCDMVIGGATGHRAKPQLKFAYDEIPADANLATIMFLSKGNDADTTASYFSHLTPDLPRYAASGTREYVYPFTDQWHTSNCNLSGNYASTAQNDIDAAIINLFTNYGRMHDWSYYLGFTESTWNMQQKNLGEDQETSQEPKDGDPEKGQAQAGAVAGSVLFTGRDNANQISLQDGAPGVTNQYLWHPLQASFYSPCVDGAYDMGVVGHEYTHAISNRMIGGPDAGIGGSEGPKMGEAWSDLAAMEYVNGFGFAPVADENPYAVGPYATGNKNEGIRNYGMNDSPLNYSQLFYDGNGQTGPHSDSEIWSAANFEVRKALIEKYDAMFPSTNKDLQFACANGEVDSKLCPGNRRWIQLMFDGFLIQDAAAGMPAAAEAQLAADVARYKGANQKEIWAAYAKRGLGDLSDEGGTPDWSTPKENNEAQVRFRTVAVDGGGVPKDAFVFVGPYTARTQEAATSSSGGASKIVQFVPGKYLFTARADGYGQYQFEKTFEAGQSYLVDVPMRKNLASETNGAEATGDGGNHFALIDDTEETNWAFLGASTDEVIEGKQVTVDLTGGTHLVKEIQVSAINRPQQSNDPYDTKGQNRFASLRSFEILTCDAATGADCEEEDSYTLVYTSPEDAFPTGRPRPTSENLRMKTFDIPDTNASHIRLRVLTNQCTGNPVYSGEQNPVGEAFSSPDCVTGFTAATLVSTDVSIPDPDAPPQANNTQRHRVRAAELQVFSSVTPGVKEVIPPKKPTPDKKPPVVAKPDAKPRMPATGVSPVLPIAGLLMAGAAAYVLRRQRTA
ncbi:MAG TPA: M36 family metallopeptidase [Frankiaceae bacterium]|nr:M36 family metallopeptidase [Frankiaceae bacterium]